MSIQSLRSEHFETAVIYYLEGSDSVKKIVFCPTTDRLWTDLANIDN